MGLETSAALLIAVSDLKVVKLLRDAINAGLPKTGPLGTIPPGANPATPRPHLKFGGGGQLNPGLRPHADTQPTPRFEPRSVVHPRAAVVDVPPVYAQLPPVGEPAKRTPAIPPVWATLPPVTHSACCVEIKVYPQKVDLINKGTLLDLFV